MYSFFQEKTNLFILFIYANLTLAVCRDCFDVIVNLSVVGIAFLGLVPRAFANFLQCSVTRFYKPFVHTQISSLVSETCGINFDKS